MAQSKKQIENPRRQTDDLVYEAVRYLDSLTNYREYLPRRARSRLGRKLPKKSTASKNDFILLDDIPVCRVSWLWACALVALLLCIAVLGLLQS